MVAAALCAGMMTLTDVNKNSVSAHAVPVRLPEVSTKHNGRGLV